MASVLQLHVNTLLENDPYEMCSAFYYYWSTAVEAQNFLLATHLRQGMGTTPIPEIVDFSEGGKPAPEKNPRKTREIN